MLWEATNTPSSFSSLTSISGLFLSVSQPSSIFSKWNLSLSVCYCFSLSTNLSTSAPYEVLQVHRDWHVRSWWTVTCIISSFFMRQSLKHFKHLKYFITKEYGQPNTALIQFLIVDYLNWNNNMPPSEKTFHRTFETWLQGFLSIVKLGTDVGLTASVPVHPRGAGWDWGQGLAQARLVLQQHTQKTTIFLYWSCFVHRVLCWKRKGLFPNCCLIYHCNCTIRIFLHLN